MEPVPSKYKYHGSDERKTAKELYDYRTLLYRLNYSEKLNSQQSNRLFSKYLDQLKQFKMDKNREINKRKNEIDRFTQDSERLGKQYMMRMFNFFFLFEKVWRVFKKNHKKLEELFEKKVKILDREYNYFFQMMKKEFIENLKLYEQHQERFKYASNTYHQKFFYSRKYKENSIPIFNNKKKIDELKYRTSVLAVGMEFKIQKLKEKFNHQDKVTMEVIKKWFNLYESMKKKCKELESVLGQKEILMKNVLVRISRMKTNWVNTVRNYSIKNEKIRIQVKSLKKIISQKRKELRLLREGKEKLYWKKKSVFQNQMIKKLEKIHKQSESIIKKHYYIVKESKKSFDDIKSDFAIESNIFKNEENICFSLENFCKRKNKVTMEINSLEEEKIKLVLINRKLRKTVKEEYIQRFTIETDDVHKKFETYQNRCERIKVKGNGNNNSILIVNSINYMS